MRCLSLILGHSRKRVQFPLPPPWLRQPNPLKPRGVPPVSGPSRSWGKPNPINTGPSQAEGIAKFACRAKHADLTAERRERLKVSVLDSLACAINALGASPIEACLAQAKEFGGPEGRCTLIGGGQANVVYAAFYNTMLERIHRLHGQLLPLHG